MNTLYLCSDLGGTAFTEKYGLGITIAIVAVLAVATAAVNIIPKLTHKSETPYQTRDITYGAVCLAMAYALSWIKVFEMPLGGSITLASLAPLFIYCYYFGFRKSTILAAAYMLLQFTQGTFIVHPLSALLDYVLPYYSICLVGLLSYSGERYAAFVKRNRSDPKKAGGAIKYWGYTIGGHRRIFAGAAIFLAVRYASSVLSGVILWDYWGYGEAATGYKLAFSLSYNSVLLIDGAIAAAAVLVLLSSRMFNRFMSTAFAKGKRRDVAHTEEDASRSEDGQNGCSYPPQEETEPQ